MSFSSLPTGTISGDGSGSRTYPPHGTKTGHTPSAAVTPRQSADALSRDARDARDARGARDAASLRRENEALRRANSHLQDKLEAVHSEQQNVVDHYERLLSEVHPQDAVGVSPRGHEVRDQSVERRSLNERVSATVRPVVGRLAAGVLRAIGLR